MSDTRWGMGTGSVAEDVLQDMLEGFVPGGPDVRWLAGLGIFWEPGGLDAPEQDAAARLRECLAEVGLEPRAVDLFAVAAETAGALARGQDLAVVTGRTTTRASSMTDTRASSMMGPAAAVPVGGVEVGGGGVGECSVGAAGLDVRVAAASGVLDLVVALSGLGAHLDAALLGVTSELSVRNGRILLARRGLEGPEALTADQVRRWRSRTRSVTRREIEAATGWGTGEVSDLVALANAPASVADPVRSSMAAGATPWRLARRFFREFGHRAHEDAAEVAGSLFGTDPDRVCTDRLDPDGQVKQGPWEHKLFHRAIDAALARLDGADPKAAVDARARARQRRDVRVCIDADGTGTVRITGTATQAAAVSDRIEKAARAARAAGDERTLAQLRADIALSLLLHSTLDLPDPLAGESELPDLVRTRWSEQMKAALLALPKAVLNVIVPFDALVHSPTRPVLATTGRTGLATPAAEVPGGAGGGRAVRCPTCGTPASPGAASGPPPASSAPPGTAAAADSGAPPGAAAAVSGSGDPPGACAGQVLSIGALTGSFPQFLTADAVRELALSPGTTLFRLLMDPAEGRCVERSIASYAPDAAMRAQVHAADVTCRAPGCIQHAPYTQLDHVLAYSAGGPTAEPNLQDLHTGHHDPKTQGEWTATMAANRDVTWRSLLGRIYRTRAHDYRQYSTLYRQTVERVDHDTQVLLDADQAARRTDRAQGVPAAGLDGRGERLEQPPMTREVALADAVDAAVYRALTYRPPARALRGGEDHPDADTHPYYLGWDIIDLTHTSQNGRRRTGPDPSTAQAEQEAQASARTDPGTSTGSCGSTGSDPHTDSDTGTGAGLDQADTARPGRSPDHDDEPPPF